MPMPSVDEIKRCFEYDHESGIVYWKDRPWSLANRQTSGKEAGCLTNIGYKLINLSVSGKQVLMKAHRVAWVLCHGEWPAGEIDHKDGNKSNNRIENLRVATRSQNVANQAARNKTGLKGCTYNPRHDTWTSSIRIDGKNKHLGSFGSAEEAYAAYLSAAEIHRGEFASHLSRPSTPAESSTQGTRFGSEEYS